MQCVDHIVRDAERDAERRAAQAAATRERKSVVTYITNSANQLFGAGSIDGSTLKMISDIVDSMSATSQGEIVDDVADSAPEPVAKQARKTKDRGSRVLPMAPPNLRYASAGVKLAWALQIYDVNVKDYVEASRHQLNRNNPIAKCYRHCCMLDEAEFLKRHGNGTGNYAISKFNPCPTCVK
jgi:hypothetical protein